MDVLDGVEAQQRWTRPWRARLDVGVAAARGATVVLGHGSERGGEAQWRVGGAVGAASSGARLG